MTTNHQIAAEFTTQLWAMDPRHLQSYTAQLAGGQQAAPTAAAARPNSASRSASTGRGITRIGISGPITHKPGFMSEWFGGSSTVEIRAALMKALADQSTDCILLDIDSPGGTVTDVDELAAEIYSARSKKPIIGLVNALCCSAAYYLGSQCTKLFSTPSGSTGSIGVFVAHMNYSAALAQAGVEVTLISAGRYKTEGSPYRPLDADAKGFVQKQIDTHYGMFIDAVARGRGVTSAKVRKDFGEGRTLMAKDAHAAGMIDGICTATQLVGKMLTDGPASVCGRNPFGASASLPSPAATPLARSLDRARTAQVLDQLAGATAKTTRQRQFEQMQRRIDLLRLA